MVVMAEMAAPAPALEAHADVERVALLLSVPVVEEPDAVEDDVDVHEVDALAPEAESPGPIVANSSPNFGTPSPKFANVSPKPKKTKPKKTKKKRSCLPNEEGIRKVGERTWEVERAVVTPYATPSRAEELAWTAWHRNAAGDIDGFVVKHMRCGSLLRQAGFKNGDVVLAVNGNPITTLLQGFNTWRKVRGDDRFRVKVKRRDGTTEVLRFKLL
jgi:hypothetical protein